MSGFVLHPAALNDLNEIWEFIAADSLGAADRIIAEIRESILKLADYPNMGFRREELSSAPLRFHPVRDFLIAYAPDETPLLVLAILSARRNPKILAAALRYRR
jgi:plasmid stabilization system protein ParE